MVSHTFFLATCLVVFLTAGNLGGWQESQPEPIYAAEPEYPEQAKQDSIEGAVIVRALVDTNGSVIDARISRGVHPSLDTAALEAARQWKFIPARHINRPVSKWIAIPIRFSLEQEQRSLEYEIQKDPMSHEEIMKRFVEEDTADYRPRLPKLIEDLGSEDCTKRDWAASGIGRARDMRGLHPLLSAVRSDKRPIVRVRAISSVFLIEDFNADTTALLDLRNTLPDSIEHVALQAALALVCLGDTLSPLTVLGSIAREDQIQKWDIDWEGYGNFSELDKTRFKDNMRTRAARALREAGTDSSLVLLKALQLASHDVIWLPDGEMTMSEYAAWLLELPSLKQGASLLMW